MWHSGMVAQPSFTIFMAAAKPPRRKAKTNFTRETNERQRSSTTETPHVAHADTPSSRLRNPGVGKRHKQPQWECIQNCGACCKLHKGPTFPSPDEIFDDPADLQKYNSMIGADGWCMYFEKSTRRCSIYADRPYFCRVEPDIFQTLYGIDKKKFNKEACSCCVDTIKAVYGSNSEELNNFNHAIWNTVSNLD